MCPGILTEYDFKHKRNHYAILPWFGTKIAQKHGKLKGSKQKHEILRFSSRRETPLSHVLNFRTTSGHNVLYMRNDVLKEISRFRLPLSGRRRLLLKVPNNPAVLAYTSVMLVVRSSGHYLYLPFVCLIFIS